MSTRRTDTRSPLRLVHALFTSAVVLTSVFVPAEHASAQVPQVGLTRVGPVDPASGYPVYYEDANGLRLGLCTDPGLCFWVLPDPALPPSFPTNWPDESFYFAAQATMTGAGASFSYLSALEAAFGGGSVLAGDQIVFTRIRIRASGLVDGASYTITHPYGVESFVAGVDGPLPGTINVTRDVGIGSPGDFTLALKGNVGSFLATSGFAGANLPGSFIGDGGTLTAVQGSPFGTNFVRIEGPGANTLFPANANGASRAQLNSFVLQGQVATRLGAAVEHVYAERSAQATVIDVWASSAVGQALVASAGGVSRAMISGANGSFYTRLELGAGAAIPTQVSVTNVTDFPETVWTKGPITDAVNVQTAIFTVNGDLVVTASSSDAVASPVLSVEIPGRAPAVLVARGAGVASGGCGLPFGAIPPTSVIVRSSNGGVDQAPVLVQGVGVPGGVVQPVVADAGPDAIAPSGTAVGLSGAASTGPIATYAWVQDLGAAVALLGADTSAPGFLAPTVAAGAQIDLSFTLTVRSAAGAISSDSVIVHVQGPPIVVPSPDVVTVRDARYNQRNVAWRVSGTTSLILGQTVTMYLGRIGDRTRRLGSAVVDPTGVFSMQQANNTAPFRPVAGDTTVWVESALGGTPGSIAFRLQ